MHGWIILDKPTGITSAHAVAKVKRLVKPKKIGHAGTLDPLASGVLPLALGEATKTIPYMMDANKAYEFTVTWGEERDTDDCEGKVTKTSDKRPTQKEIEAILPPFTGRIQQMPPDYSALKIDGKRAYDMARAGETVELKAREVRVDLLSLLPSPLEGEGRVGGTRNKLSAESVAPPPLPNPPPQGGREYTDFLCHCGKGTYIRSLARDMGRELGCFGHISRLRRIRVGKFDETYAISLEKLEEAVYKGGLGFLHPVSSALDDILAVDITEPQAARLRRGQNVVFPLPAETSVLLARCNGDAVALCEGKAGHLRPVRVFNYSGQ